jgi:hypothetical protein
VVNRKEPELEPEPQFVISAPAPGGHIILGSGSATLTFTMRSVTDGGCAQVSGDWWRGSVGGREGLIPDKYILLKIR